VTDWAAVKVPAAGVKVGVAAVGVIVVRPPPLLPPQPEIRKAKNPKERMILRMTRDLTETALRSRSRGSCLE
jgi:hypothetical protein